MQQINHYFITDGDRESGKYKVYEVKYGVERIVFEVENMKKGGLKECRQFIGNYLVKKYNYNSDRIVPHQCVKPGRIKSKNPWMLDCTVKDYIDGIDPQKN